VAVTPNTRKNLASIPQSKAHAQKQLTSGPNDFSLPGTGVSALVLLIIFLVIFLFLFDAVLAILMAILLALLIIWVLRELRVIDK
ncbi:hypothetical protein JYT14_00955, partial [Flavobacteriales bacterium AH-315-E23]|nr:hypothetical protein [Flavobacteriales bacterium AH-315-E23]